MVRTADHPGGPGQADAPGQNEISQAVRVCGLVLALALLFLAAYATGAALRPVRDRSHAHGSPMHMTGTGAVHARAGARYGAGSNAGD
ncbi:MAG TPA: hypothetical protein VMA95_15650 [Streptosporangiaceae bacterium]|nr:hypothetical protein [Streptosporangiaceae bacterium]